MASNPSLPNWPFKIELNEHEWNHQHLSPKTRVHYGVTNK
jgi:hypothetical protein